MTEIVYSALQIELDSLLDTRLGLLFSQEPEAVGRALRNQYLERQEDRFEGFDTKVFHTLYRQRDKRVLQHAIATPLLRFVKEFALETHHNTVTTPFNLFPKIILNIYPYVLSDEETAVLIGMLVHVTNQLADVQVVSMSLEDTTPAYVKQHLSVLVLYDYWKWLETHSVSQAFKRTTCPEVTLIGPALYFNGMPSMSDLERAKRSKTTPFAAMETLAAPFIGLKIFPVSFFSIALGDGITPPVPNQAQEVMETPSGQGVELFEVEGLSADVGLTGDGVLDDETGVEDGSGDTWG